MLLSGQDSEIEIGYFSSLAVTDPGAIPEWSSWKEAVQGVLSPWAFWWAGIEFGHFQIQINVIGGMVACYLYTTEKYFFNDNNNNNYFLDFNKKKYSQVSHF